MVSLLRRTAAGVAFGVLALFFATSAVHAQTLINPSFETPVYSTDNWYQNPTGAGIGWSFTGIAGIRYFASPNGSNGRQTAYLAAEGTTASLGKMTQTLTLPVGTYQVRYLAARGAGYDAGGSGAVQPVQFSVGPAGQTLVARGGAIYPRWNSPKVQPNVRVAPTYAESGFETWWTEPFTITSAGSYTIAFAATDPTALESQDSTTYIDEVVLVQTRAQFVNGGFEAVNADGMTPTGWSDLGYGVTRQSGVSAGGEGGAALRLVFAGGGSISQTITTPAGRYSVSARIRKDSAGYACPISITRTVNSTATTLATLPPAPGADFMAVTSDSFDLPAGTHLISFRCFSSTQWVYIDAVTLNTAGPSFANPSLESPTAANPAAVGYLPPGYFNPESGAYLNAPAGSSWGFAPGTTTAGFMRNPVPYVQGGSTQLYMWPYTTWGGQYAYLSSGWMEQTLALNSGRYVVVFPAAAYYQPANIAVKVNGTTVATLPNVASPDLGFTERMTSSFAIAAPGNYTIRFEGAATMIDAPRIVQTITNQPPVVTITAPTLAAGKTYALVQGPTASGITVSATATDPDGFTAGGLYVTQNGAQVGSPSSVSPYGATLGTLNAGSYTIAAWATDGNALAGSSSITLKVNSPPSAGFLMSPSGTVSTPYATPAAITVTPTPTDTDGTIARVEVLVDGVVQSNCTKTVAPWACVVSLGGRATAYAISVRVTDNDDGVSTSSSSSVTVNSLPTVTITSPASGTTYSAPATIVLSATASDLDGTVNTVQFFNSTTTFNASTLIGTVTAGQTATAGQPAQNGSFFVYNWSTSTLGNLPVVAVASDNRGGVSLLSPSITLTVAVNSPSTTALAISPSPSTFGQSVTLTATVTPSTATGNVVFKENGNALAACGGSTGIALPASGARTASCTFDPGNAAAHNYMALYGGATSIAGSSGSASLVVNKQNTTTAASFSPTTPVAGQSLVITATVSPATATGTVNFTDGGATIVGCGAQVISGTTTKTATCNVPVAAVTAGTHTYGMAYSGDSNSNPSSASQNLLVLIASATVVVVAPEPSTYNIARTITATVTPNSATGTVNFIEAGATLPGCNARPLTGTTTKTATCTVAANSSAAGSHPYSAVYSGNATIATSTGSATHTVNKAVTAIALTSVPSSPVATQSYQLTAAVSPNTATGTVNFTENGNSLPNCAASPVTGTTTKTATCTVAGTASLAGSHTYVAGFSGDANHAVSSGTSTLLVKGVASVTLTANPPVLVTGSQVVLTATIAPSSATGTVNFREGGTTYCLNVALVGTTTKTASCNVVGSAVTAGSHTYTADYSGDSNLAPGSGSLKVLAQSATTVSVSPTPSTYGVSRTITATVTPAAATGSVAFTDNGSAIPACAAQPVSGSTTKTASCTFSSGNAGSHTYAASFSGDASYAPSSGSVAHTVNKLTPTLTSSASPSAPTAGQVATLMGTVSSAAATGAVSFAEGTTTYCGASALPVITPNAATCPISPTAGDHTYTLAYAGDANHNPVSVTFALTVIANLVPTVYISTPTSAVSILYSPSTAYTVIAKANDADNGISSIQLRNNGTNLDSTPLVTTDGTACTFSPVTPGAERTCSAAIPAGTPVGAQCITAVASDGTTSTTSAAIVVTIQPAPIVCTLSATTPVSGAATTVLANCQSGGANLPGVTIAWTGNCASSTTTTDASGNASCTTNALTVPSNFSITATRVNYSAANPAATLTVTPQNATVAIANFSAGGQSGSVASVPSGTNAVVSIASTGTCSSGETVALSVNGTSLYGPGAPVGSVSFPITGAGVFQAVATRTCSAPVFSVTSSASSLTVQAVTEAPLADVETAAVTASLTANGEVAGAIPGSATVNPSGAVTYSIGVPVAPGSAGMQPSLALQYSSQGGRGIVGTGWSLSGFSTIHRCPATVVLDTFKGRVGFDGDDRYCLDGMRLITLGGLDGADGTEYRTERDSYARIYSYGSSGTGPTSWTVETKSGQTLTFAAPLYKSNATGNGSESSKIKAWGISRAEDTVGNYMTFAYTVNHNKGWMLPLSISYTGNTVAGTPPYATVELAYDSSAKNDSAVIYDGTGSYGEIPPVVTGITSKVDGLVSQQMNIEYESSPTTGRTRLKAVQMCGSGINTATGLCLQKTTFTYNNAAVDVATPWRDIGTTGFSVDPNPANPGKGLLALDLNGDGKTELFQSNLFDTAAYSAVISNATDACIQASICGVSGSQGIPVPLTTIGGRLSKLQLGDFNGDGVTDFVALISSIEFSAVRFIVCLGQQATPTVFACEVKLDWGSQNQYRNFAQTGLDGSFGGWLFPDFVVGDFDGDGRTDVLEFTTFQMYWDQFTSAPDNWMYFGGTDARKRPVSFDTTPAVDNLSLGDFDGDGRMDIAVLTADVPTGYGTWKTWLSRTLNTDVITSVAGAAFSPAITTNGPRKHDYQPHIPDANGDGLADMLAFDDQTAPGADLGQFAYQGCMSRGNGTFECTTWRGPPGGDFAPFGPTNLRFSSVVFGDFNGDGRTDIAIADVDGSICNSLNQATFNCTIGQAIEGPKSWLICPSIPSASADSPRGRFDCGAGTVGNVLSGNGWWAGGLRRKGCTGVDPSGTCVIRSYDLVVGGDFNGDGRTGLAGGTPLSGNPHITRPNILDPVAKIPDMLASVTNGLGFTNSFTYKPITDSGVYTKYNSGNAYPVLNIQTAMYVAATASHDDGVGGQQTYTYAYEGLKGHVTGGGTLGFAKVRVTDGKSQIVTETEYDNTYPARGLVKATRKWNASTSLNESTTDYVLVRPYSNLAIHSYLPVASTEKSWDLNGAALPVTKTTSGYGALGSPINSALWGTYFVGDVNTKYGCATDVGAKTYATAADTTEQFAKVSTNGYDNSTLANAWRLCRLRTAQVVSSQNVYMNETASETRNSSFDYNDKGLLKQEVVQPGIGVAPELTLTTNYFHDDFGNRKQADVVGWNGITTETRTSKTNYDTRGRFPLSSENPMGPTQTESYTWDEKLGVQFTLTGPNGLTTTSKYDKLGRKVVEQRADGSKSVMVYNAAVNAFGGLTVTSRTTGGGESSAESDKLGREVRKSVLISDNGTVRMSYVSTEYDNRGRVSRTSRPYWSTSSPVYPCLRHYDDLDRIDNEGCANDDGSATSTVTEYAYNLNALQTRVSVTANDTTGTPSTRSSVSEVDARGKSKKTTNTNGNTVEHAYDGAGNLTRTTRTVGTDKMVTVIGYDLRGRKTSLSDADTGSFGYTYTAFGELLVQTDAKLQKITSSYDALGRVKQRISDVDLVSNYIYDTCSMGIGKLCVVRASGTASPSGTTSVVGHQRELTYDLYGRLQSETTRTATSASGALAAGARVYTASTTFDGASRVKQITYPNGQFVTRQYDATGAWNKLVGSTGTVLWQGGNADAEARWLNWSLGNGLTTSTAFGGNTGRLGSLTTSGGVQGLSLTYDGFGNIKSRLDAANGYRQNNGTAETFVYDTLNQLTQANFLEGTQNIAYDGFGRIQTKTGVNAVAGTYAYRPLTTNGSSTSNQLQAANGRNYGYDANGNVDTITGSAIGTITLSWTSFNQPMTLPVAAAQNAGASATGNAGGVITLKYGADNQRVLEQLPIDVSVTGANQTANRFVLHSGASLFFEEDVKTDGSSEARAYLTGPLGVVAVHTTPSAGNATLTYWHRDHLGSLTVTTNEQGVVKDRMRFDPWGKLMTPLGARTGSGDRGFTGHEHLAGGLIHMNGRVYDPVLGRFLSADIVVQFPDAVTSYNRYAYVLNNPLAYTDPSGYFIDVIVAAVIANATYFAAAAVITAGYQSYKGNDLNAERWTFAAMFIATAGAAGPVGTVLQGFAAGGLQSGSIEGAIVGAMTAGTLQGLGALAKGIFGNLGAFASAANDATASSSFKFSVGSVAGCLGCIDTVVVSGPKLLDDGNFYRLFSATIPAAAAAAAGSGVRPMEGVSISARKWSPAVNELLEFAKWGTPFGSLLSCASGYEECSGAGWGLAVLGVNPIGKAGSLHHICTNKNCIQALGNGPWTPKFAEMFEKAGMTLADKANLVRVVDHAGPHSPAYHQLIYDRLTVVTQSLSGNAYATALRTELTAIAKEISTPGSILNKLVTK